MADDDVLLEPVMNSPVLQRVGVTTTFNGAKPPTQEEWRKGRTAAYGQTELKATAEKGVEEEIINGLLVKHYN